MAFHNVSFSYSGKKEAGCKPLQGTSGYCKHNDASSTGQLPMLALHVAKFADKFHFVESLVLIHTLGSLLSTKGTCEA